jgi:hypothetical protein
MLTPLTVAASVLVPNQGWLIFGGFGSSLLTTQKLQATSGSWTAGPDLYNNENDYEHCGVQVHKPLLNIQSYLTKRPPVNNGHLSTTASLSRQRPV